MPLPAAPSSSRQRPPWSRQALFVVRALDILAALYAAVGLIAVALLVQALAADGRATWRIDAQFAPAAAELPEVLGNRAQWGSRQVGLEVRPAEVPGYTLLWLLRVGIGLALTYVGYRTLRAVASGFASGAAFTFAGARWTCRLGRFGMIGTLAMLLLQAPLHLLASWHVDELARDAPGLRMGPVVLDTTILFHFLLFFLLWLLGGAMHRATIYESDARDTI